MSVRLKNRLRDVIKKAEEESRTLRAKRNIAPDSPERVAKKRWQSALRSLDLAMSKIESAEEAEDEARKKS
jgi:hypothetical protein